MSVDEDTVLFLGGSSFLGLQTAQTLYYYFNIICTYNQSIAPKFFPEFNWFQLNFLENNDSLRLNLRRLIDKTNATFLINFTGVSSPLEAKIDRNKSKKVNDTANSIIAEICGDTDTIPIFISSDHVFNGLSGPYSEKETPEPIKNSVYGHQKLQAEQYYEKLENYAIVRISTTLGLNFHFQRPNFYSKAITKLSIGEPIIGATNKIRTITHCYNVAFLINKIIEAFNEKKIENGIYHVPGTLQSEYQTLLNIAESHHFDTSLVEKTQIDTDGDSYPLKLGLKSKQTVNKIQGKYLSLQEGLHLLNFEFQN